MANKTILTIGNESFDLLSYHNHLFYPNPLDKMFHDSEIFEEIKNPIEIFGSMRKYECWQQNLLAGYDHPSLCSNAYRPYSNLLGGVFTFTIESTGKEDVFEDSVRTRKDYKIPLHHGIIRFYNSSDEYMPFQQIEFWDGFVCHLSESFCSTGSKPMTMQVSISPATIRVNKSIVRQQCWWQTDINAKGKATTEDGHEPFVDEVYWRSEDMEHLLKRKDLMLNHNLRLKVQLSDFLDGDSVELTIKQNKGRRIKGNGTEFTISGKCDENGLIVFDDFKVECDFKGDNQDFGMIEFYHKERKVAEFEENFGWTYIKEGGMTKIFVNLGLEIEYMAVGCTEADDKSAIQEQFKRTLELSSGGTMTGKLFFTGTPSANLPQVIPRLSFKLHENDKKNGEGDTVLTNITVKTSKKDQWNLLMELAITSVHELMHSLRLDHPFERTQTTDTKLIKIKHNHFKTTETTNPDIYYNILNYDANVINGKSLNDLWKYKLPEFLTKQQLDFISKEIDLQQKGAGCYINSNPKTVEVNDDGLIYPVRESDAYWDQNRPGTEIETL